MTHDIKISDLTFADDSIYKTQRVKIGSKSIVTPAKAVDLNLAARMRSVPLNHSIRGVNEVFKTFKPESIQKATTTDRERDIDNEIQRVIRTLATDSDVNICFTRYDGSGLPTSKEMEYLTDLAHAHSDITPLPLTPKQFSGDNTKTFDQRRFDQYHKFVTDAIDGINVLNNKPIMGVIPIKLASVFIPSLIETYEKKGITAFCLDFDGGTISSSLTKLRLIVKTLQAKKLLDKSFIYAINLGQGRLPKSEAVVPAKDILSYGYSFDTIGGTHIQPKLSPEVRARLMAAQNITENSTRIFNKDDYGYYRLSRIANVGQALPKDTSVSAALLGRHALQSSVAKMFNQEQQGIEALHLRKVIQESHNMIPYLNKKAYVDQVELKHLKTIKGKK